MTGLLRLLVCADMRMELTELSFPLGGGEVFISSSLYGLHQLPDMVIMDSIFSVFP